MCSTHDVEHLVPEWRQRALARIAETGQNLATVDTTGVVLDAAARLEMIQSSRHRALDGFPTEDESAAFARSLR